MTQAILLYASDAPGCGTVEDRVAPSQPDTYQTETTDFRGLRRLFGEKNAEIPVAAMPALMLTNAGLESE